MNIKKYKQQYEYECPCGYIWIDSENNGCPMCGETEDIITTIYESLLPEKFNKNKSFYLSEATKWEI